MYTCTGVMSVLGRWHSCCWTTCLCTQVGVDILACILYVFMEDTTRWHADMPLDSWPFLIPILLQHCSFVLVHFASSVHIALISEDMHNWHCKWTQNTWSSPRAYPNTLLQASQPSASSTPLQIQCYHSVY